MIIAVSRIGKARIAPVSVIGKHHTPILHRVGDVVVPEQAGHLNVTIGVQADGVPGDDALVENHVIVRAVSDIDPFGAGVAGDGGVQKVGRVLDRSARALPRGVVAGDERVGEPEAGAAQIKAAAALHRDVVHKARPRNVQDGVAVRIEAAAVPAAAQGAAAGRVGAHDDALHHQGAIVHVQPAPLSHADLAGGILLPHVVRGSQNAGAIEIQPAAVAKTAESARVARGGCVSLPGIARRDKAAFKSDKAAAAQAGVGLAGDVVGDGVAGQGGGCAALDVESAAAPAAVGTSDVAAHGVADHLYRANLEQRHPAAASGQRLCGRVAGGVGQNPVLLEGDVRIIREQDTAAHAPFGCTAPVVLNNVFGEKRLAVLADVHAAAPALVVLRRAIALDLVGVEHDRAALVDVHAAALSIAAAGGVGQDPVRRQSRLVAVLQRDAAAITFVGSGGVILEGIVDHLRLAAGEHQSAAGAAMALAGDVAGERVALDQGRVASDHHPTARAIVKRVRRGDVAGKGVGEHLRRAVEQVEAAAISTVACAGRGRVVVDGVVFQHHAIGADQRHSAAIAVLDRSTRARHGSDVAVDLRVAQRHGGPI